MCCVYIGNKHDSVYYSVIGTLQKYRYIYVKVYAEDYVHCFCIDRNTLLVVFMIYLFIFLWLIISNDKIVDGKQ